MLLTLMTIFALFLVSIKSGRETKRFLVLLKKRDMEVWEKHGAIDPEDEFNPRRIKLSFEIGFNDLAISPNSKETLVSYRKLQALFWVKFPLIILFLYFGFLGRG